MMLEKTSECNTTSNFLDIDGCRVHYLQAGRAGTPIVFLHGGASDSADWLPLMEGMCRRHRLYAPDFIGYGLSDDPKPSYSLDDFTESARKFTQQAVGGPSAFIGHSLGGRVAIDLAIKTPDLVSKIVLISTTGFGKITILGSLLLLFFETTRKVLRQKPVHPEFNFNHGDANLICTEDLRLVKAPVLLLWGDRDPYYPLSDARKAAGLLPRGKLRVLAGRRHGPHKESPQEATAIIREFLEE